MKPTFKTIDLNQEDSRSLKFLYKNPIGRMFLKILVQPVFSKIGGAVLDSRLSIPYIQSFIKSNQIQMDRYTEKKYRSFNDFFKRELINPPNPQTLDVDTFYSPCDGKVSVYPITENQSFYIKKSEYRIKDLLQDEALAQEYMNGQMLIFRLTPDDYHHYAYFDSGQIRSQKKIKGVLHTVRPISLEQENVYIRNAREVTVMETAHFGLVTQIEVGALLVGKIVNLKDAGAFNAFEKKGYFEFGGSTIILLFKENSVELSTELIDNTQKDQESIVKLGDKLGTRMEPKNA
ncbi:phosphatidylserine decarboxylase [Isobaculum melis]|uniref:Phosphatidylserine decarboxylase n=1 Tax=Isobaculum melis TaxID=142588 RepID=A0A1H9TK25_9LACT|nr:phosphatidylserine decarboxylase [Isobaculum melis]SER97472.1 phosphatidylserine decarboxylase [Isobaculum melis]